MVAKHTKEVLQEAANASVSVAGVLRYLGLRQAGGTQAHIARKIREFDVNTSHFLGQAHGKGKKALTRKCASDILRKLPEGSNRAKREHLVRALTEVGIAYICAECLIEPTWCGKPLTLEIDHIDGDWLNNVKENLRYLCPNCHSQQSHTNMPHKYKPA
jgi:hypothetical protein